MRQWGRAGGGERSLWLRRSAEGRWRDLHEGKLSSRAGRGKGRQAALAGGRLRGALLLPFRQQPALDRRGRPFSVRLAQREGVGLEDDRAQLGEVPAAVVVEVHKPERPPGQGLLQIIQRRRACEAVLAMQIVDSADQAMPTAAI